jgi:flavin reductase (DIM6/NTAB) family NADH-FMN oxidoreductase RutF
MAVTGDEFRAALAHWASGVAIVTSAAGDRIHGMTVSAFSSVSLDPPLVLVCADKTSNTLGVIEAGGVFAANILSAGQQGLSDLFASKRDEERRFDGLAWRRGVTGAPILPGALAVLDCRVVAAHDAGDHVIYVGRVEGAEVMDGEPLLYYAGGYRGVSPPEAH